VKVDESLCTGCGLCSDSAPDVFELGDDSVAKVKVNPVPAASEGLAKQAKDDCPSEAITIE
jgi:ferredoxin